MSVSTGRAPPPSRCGPTPVPGHWVLRAASCRSWAGVRSPTSSTRRCAPDGRTPSPAPSATTARPPRPWYGRWGGPAGGGGDVVEKAQHSLLPPSLPLLPDLWLSGSYHRASSVRAAGGDWYDAVP